VLSESGLWVFLDNFGGLERLPLESWTERVLPFDPRNDGYAEKLHLFFVHGGKRFFFVPLAGKRFQKFEKALPGVLGAPFSLDFYGYGAPLYPFIILFFAAGLGFLFLSKSFLSAAVLPAMAAFSLGGPRPLVLAGFLAAFTRLLAEPVFELFVSRRYRAYGGAVRLWECMAPYRKLLFSAAALLACYCFTALSGTFFEMILAGMTAAAAAGIFVLSVRLESLRGKPQKHVRFRAVPILREEVKMKFFPVEALPFTLAALLALIPALLPGPMNFGGGTIEALESFLVSEDDYLAHASFQAGFSYRPLSGGDSAYFSYTVDGNPAGLPELPPFPESSVPEDVSADIPPFPLGGLVNFLKNSGREARPVLPGLRDTVPVLLLFLCSLSALIRGRRGGKIAGNIVLYKRRMYSAPERVLL
jgi:hypothetical protein